VNRTQRFAVRQRQQEVTLSHLHSDDEQERSKGAAQLVARERFAWPGGYALFAVTNDGGVLCADCVRSEYYQVAYSRRYNVDDGWNIVAWDSMANNDEPVTCDHCGRTIE
jgi:hypothetical protein